MRLRRGNAGDKVSKFSWNWVAVTFAKREDIRRFKAVVPRRRHFAGKVPSGDPPQGGLSGYAANLSDLAWSQVASMRKDGERWTHEGGL